jgi:hypothetical protein
VRLGYGAQTFAQRQIDDVIVGCTDGFEPVFDASGRRIDQAGAVLAGRMEGRVWGPLRGWGGGAYFGLGGQRTRGGTVEEDGALVQPGSAATRARLVFGGGSTWFYAAVCF